MKNSFFICFLFGLIVSCQKSDWNNPFDPTIDKQLFTPSGLTATQVNNAILLKWNPVNKNISGYKIERKIANSLTIEIAKVNKDQFEYLDNNIAIGKFHTYLITAYADQNLSNTIGIEITPVGPPIISTIAAKTTTYSSIEFDVSNINDQGGPITKKGICWSYTNSNPTILDNLQIEGLGNSNFVSKIISLKNNIIIYSRPFATNSSGTSYGPLVTNTLYLNKTDGTINDLENNIYPTVRIGNQIWMSKNLVSTKYNNGASIPLITDGNQWINTTQGAYCDFNNDINIGKVYGHLYNHYSVSDSRNICPLGWHVPTKTEFETLINYLGGAAEAGIKLKESGSLYWMQSNANGDNSSGFSARAGAWRSQDAGFYYGVTIGGALFWTSTKDDNKYPWVMGIQIFDAFTSAKIVKDAYFESGAGTSIRCLKN